MIGSMPARCGCDRRLRPRHYRGDRTNGGARILALGGPDKWFEKDAAFDAEIAARFSCLWQAGRDGKLTPWKETPEGALALVIVLDQFPRNMFRGDRRAYETDGVARSVPGRAIGRGFDRQISHPERQFFYLPFQHSENLADQERCVELARGYGDDEFTKYA